MVGDFVGVLVDDNGREALDLVGTVLQVSVRDGRIVIDDCDVVSWVDESVS